MKLTSNQESELAVLSSSALWKGTLALIKPKSPAQLLSAARSEFIQKRGAFDGSWMQLLTKLMHHISNEVYGTNFIWSDYNVSQWLKFVIPTVGPEGGACMFSMESDGGLPAEIDNRTFKGLGLGTPLGMFPYELFFPLESNTDKLTKALAEFRYD